MTTRKYFIKTFGCQANEADSGRMAGILEVLGLESAKSLSELGKQDLLVLNTCSIRQKSEDKVYGYGKVFKKLVEAGKSKPFVVLAGCMTGSAVGDRKRIEFNELKQKTPWVNVYINPSQIGEIANILAKEKFLSKNEISKYDFSRVDSKLGDSKSALVNVSYGCDNFCSFCVVPHARGKEISRSKEEILKEINNLVKREITEITLCGQNVNSWGLSSDEKFKIRAGSNQKLPFANLLREVCKIKGVKKVSFISSNPFDFTQDLVNTLKNKKIANYVHIALQSGNNEVLKKMNRRHTVEEFEDLIKRIKKVRPGIEIGTDIIVGFSGETQEQFMDTVNLMKKLKFNVAFISMYSQRKGTTAQKLYKDDISLKEKKRRLALITKVWKENQPLIKS